MGGKRLYENVVIGNFLYGLGYAVRAKRDSGVTAAVINLLQQTPSDKLLGDLLVEFPGVVRLIEFKTSENRSGKEPARHRKLWARLQDDTRLQVVSRSVHWYVESATPDGEFRVRIVPYLDAYEIRPRTDRPERPARRIATDPAQMQDRLETFIERTALEVAHGDSAISQEDAKSYLQWVRMTQSDGEVGTGGLLLVADADGTLHYAFLQDLLELRLQHRLWLELNEKRLERELEFQRQLNQEMARELAPRDRGAGL